VKKFKKAMALTLSLAMGLSLVACGKDEKKEETTTEATTTEAKEEETEEATGDDAETTEAAELDLSNDGKVLNIAVWNSEFAERMRDFYPGYEVNDKDAPLDGGKIGDITVNFIQTSNQDNAYQNKLDQDLAKNSSAADDEKIDIFLVEADYALKYVDSPYTADVMSFGLTDAELANQFDYTKDIVTDASGVLKGVSWQACSAMLIYNRAIAKEVLGSDDPAEVQKAVKDWDAYNETAATMKDSNYKMSSTVNDTFRVFSNNVTTPWVVDDTVKVDDNLKKWAEMSKEQVEAGETETYDLWSADWSKPMFKNPGDVFCYFGPAWFFAFSLQQDGAEGTIAEDGGWGVCPGPQPFYWGGTWICATPDTDNPALVGDIMRQMTTNDEVMMNIATGASDCVNNQNVLAELAADDSLGGIATIGGQNPYADLLESAKTVDMSNITAYDQGCNEEFQKAMKAYFEGKSTKDEAIEAFYKAVKEKYPELKTE